MLKHIATCALIAATPCAAETQGDLPVKAPPKTIQEVAALEAVYEKLIKEEGCAVAVPAIRAFSQAATDTSAALKLGADPFYRASRSRQEQIAKSRYFDAEIVPAEKAYLDLQFRRHLADVEHAKCLLTLDQDDLAIQILTNTLKQIDNRHYGPWQTARRLLWQELGFTPHK